MNGRVKERKKGREVVKKCTVSEKGEEGEKKRMQMAKAKK